MRRARSLSSRTRSKYRSGNNSQPSTPCAATRHAHFVLDGSGPAYLTPPSLDLWPHVNWAPDYNKSKKVNLNTLTKEEVASWKPGDTLLLNGGVFRAAALAFEQF